MVERQEAVVVALDEPAQLERVGGAAAVAAGTKPTLAAARGRFGAGLPATWRRRGGRWGDGPWGVRGRVAHVVFTSG